MSSSASSKNASTAKPSSSTAMATTSTSSSPAIASSIPMESSKQFMKDHKVMIITSTLAVVIFMLFIAYLAISYWTTSNNTNELAEIDTSQMIVPATFPFYGSVVQASQTKNVTAKNVTLAPGAWTPALSLAASSPGAIRTITIELLASAPPDSVAGGLNPVSASTFIAIKFDGATNPQVGNLMSSPSIGNATLGASAALNCDALFTSLIVGVEYQGDNGGSNDDSNTTAGMRMSETMPFNTGFTVYLYNGAVSGGSPIPISFTMNIEYDMFPASYVMTPLRYHCQAVTTFGATSNTTSTNTSSQVLSWPNEQPLFSGASTNGVYLRMVKAYMQGVSASAAAAGSPALSNPNNWHQGTFRIYTGGAGMTSIINGNHTGGYDNSSILLYQSTEVADFYLSTNASTNSQYFANDRAGLLALTNGPGTGLAVANTSGGNAASGVGVTFYRMFGTEVNSFPPNSPGSSSSSVPLTVTFTCGNAATGNSNTNVVSYTIVSTYQ